MDKRRLTTALATHFVNPITKWAVTHDLATGTYAILETTGRRSGEPRQTPVNLLTLDGERYLVSPRGHTQWVRNLRASGEGRLLLGRRSEPFTATEVPDDERPRVLRPYLRRWRMEVGVFFGGVGPDSPDEDLRRIAPDHPVFRLGPPRAT